ncbi:MAG: zinc/iron permease [Bacteroidetes bacterium]|nr:MAG: zinc/iron permease [Bacteroidota bacterium]
MHTESYLLLFLSVVIGGGLGFYFRKNNPALLQMVLSFSGAYLLGIAVLHLMPAVFSGADTCVGLWVLLGFFIQLLLEQMSGGVEHGHIHPVHHPARGYALSVMAGLCIHAFFEGIPLAHYPEFAQIGHAHSHEHNHLLYGIVLHKAPAAFALTILFLVSGFRTRFIVFCLALFGSMSPLAAFLAGRISLESHVHSIAVAIVLGSLLHISTTILFELDNAKNHRISALKLGVVVLGMGLAILTEIG